MHVVPYVSVDGAFGGPIAVVRGQTAALAALGHDVVVLAGWDGEAQLDIPGVEVRLFRVRQTVPGTGFSGLTAPGLTRALTASRCDVVHVHLGRHLITVLAARSAQRAGLRTVVQGHGMIMPSRAPKALLTDRVVTRRVLRRAAAVLVLTTQEERGVQAVAQARLPVLSVPNGIAASAAVAQRTAPAGRDVVFLARLHPRKRVLAYAKAAAILRAAGEPARFAVVGPDEGDLPRLRQLVAADGLEEVVIYEGALPSGAGAARISRADVYVLPAEREVFPMSVLEAMSVGTPVVLARDCGIAPELEAAGAAVVVDGDPASIADAVGALLGDPAHWRTVADRALLMIERRLSIGAVATTLLSVYSGAEDPRDDGAGRSAS